MFIQQDKYTRTLKLKWK